MKQPTTHEDQRFIVGMLANDPKTIKEIYSKYLPQIKSFIIRHGGSEEDSKDIFQDALMNIYRQATNKGFTLTCPFGAFLYLVCKGKLIDELKKRKRTGVTIHDLEQYKDIEIAPQLYDDNSTEQAKNDLFWEKYKELSARCQELLKLSWSGISMKEVAEKMDISYGYARKRKTECVDNLVQLIKSAPTYPLILSQDL